MTDRPKNPAMHTASAYAKSLKAIISQCGYDEKNVILVTDPERITRLYAGTFGLDGATPHALVICEIGGLNLYPDSVNLDGQRFEIPGRPAESVTCENVMSFVLRFDHAEHERDDSTPVAEHISYLAEITGRVARLIEQSERQRAAAAEQINQSAWGALYALEWADTLAQAAFIERALTPIAATLAALDNAPRADRNHRVREALRATSAELARQLTTETRPSASGHAFRNSTNEARRAGSARLLREITEWLEWLDRE